MSAQVVLLSLDWARHAPYLDKVRVRGSCWTFIFTYGQSSSQGSRVQRDLKNEKSKDKGKRPIQRRIAKGNERPPVNQARRRSRKETLPFPSGATRRERVIGQHEEKAVDEDSQASQTSKTCSSYEKKPARTKKIPKKQRQLLKQVPTRNPYRKRNRGKGAT